MLTGITVDCCKAIDSYLCYKKMAEIKLLVFLFQNFYS